MSVNLPYYSYRDVHMNWGRPCQGHYYTISSLFLPFAFLILDKICPLQDDAFEK